MSSTDQPFFTLKQKLLLESKERQRKNTEEKRIKAQPIDQIGASCLKDSKADIVKHKRQNTTPEPYHSDCDYYNYTVENKAMIPESFIQLSQVKAQERKD